MLQRENWLASQRVHVVVSACRAQGDRYSSFSLTCEPDILKTVPDGCIEHSQEFPRRSCSLVPVAVAAQLVSPRPRLFRISLTVLVHVQVRAFPDVVSTRGVPYHIPRPRNRAVGWRAIRETRPLPPQGRQGTPPFNARRVFTFVPKV